MCERGDYANLMPALLTIVLLTNLPGELGWIVEGLCSANPLLGGVQPVCNDGTLIAKCSIQYLFNFGIITVKEIPEKCVNLDKSTVNFYQ